MRAGGGALAGVVTAVVLVSGGCGFTGIYDLPLPGGAELGEHPRTVKVHFGDVLDLVPQSGVKVNEVAVGRVEKIDLAADGWTAEVTLRINGDVALPANAVAKVRQSSLLGEKYVELSTPPSGHARGVLADGAVIPIDRTSRNTEVEEVLGAMSMLLNGGGVEQLRTISHELNAALEGNESNIRAMLDNLNVFVAALDASKNDITRAIDGLNRLAATLNNQRDQIATTLDHLGPGLQVLADQREQLVTMLQALESLSDVAVDTVQQSQADTVADLKALLPVLRKLGEAGDDLPQALELLFTVPFSDEAVKGVQGDYFNLYARIDMNLQSVVDNLSRSNNGPVGGTPAPTPPPGTGPPNGVLPDLGSLLPLPPVGLPGGSTGSGGGDQGAGLDGILDVLVGGGR